MQQVVVISELSVAASEQAPKDLACTTRIIQVDYCHTSLDQIHPTVECPHMSSTGPLFRVCHSIVHSYPSRRANNIPHRERPVSNQCFRLPNQIPGNLSDP